MWNATKIKREQRRLDEMVTSVGMPPGWAPVGRDKKGWVYRWHKGASYVEHNGNRWYWSLLGEGAPREKDSLSDVFGGWDD